MVTSHFILWTFVNVFIPQITHHSGSNLFLSDTNLYNFSIRKMAVSVQFSGQGYVYDLLIWFEHILLHDLSAKGLGTSSENLESILLYNIIFIQLSEQNGKVTRLIFQLYILHVILLYYILKYSI